MPRRSPSAMRDHALFIAFAPADNPRIAIAIVVENGGFGARAAAPIARKALDYYLLRQAAADKDRPPSEAGPSRVGRRRPEPTPRPTALAGRRTPCNKDCTMACRRAPLARAAHRALLHRVRRAAGADLLPAAVRTGLVTLYSAGIDFPGRGRRPDAQHR